MDLLLEQLAGRERDQRQLVDRRAVLLLRRPQDGEVHEVDGGVRLEQVAPGALAGMRLAGHQQHAQLVAHAVDRDHGAVVDGRQLVVERRGLDLDDVRPGMRDLHVDADLLADAHVALVDGLAVAAHGDLRVAGRHALVLDPVGDGLRLPDDAEARRRDQHDAAVALVRAAGDQRMHGRGEAERRGVGRHVVHAPVGDEDRAGDALAAARRSSAALQRGEQPRAVGLAARIRRPRRSALRDWGCVRAARTSAARTASVCLVRSPNSWLALLSTTTMATEVSGSRSSRVNDGLASASTNSASAAARTKAPRLREASSRIASTTATASADHTTVVGDERSE